jgi:hypothetical protein
MDQRAAPAYRLRGRKLPESAIAQFSPFFEESLLQQVRLVRVPALENPKFLEAYRATFADKGLPLLDFTSFAGITYIDTILLLDEFAETDFDLPCFMSWCTPGNMSSWVRRNSWNCISWAGSIRGLIMPPSPWKWTPMSYRIALKPSQAFPSPSKTRSPAAWS